MDETLGVLVLVCEYDADCESLGEGEADAEQASITDNDGLKYLRTHAGDTTYVVMHYTQVAQTEHIMMVDGLRKINKGARELSCAYSQQH